jgi:hypothetical protein
MSQSSSRSGKRSRDSSSRKSSRTSNTKNISAYYAEFVQKMIDNGVYLDGYSLVEGTRAPKFNNMKEMREMLLRPRPSLSPSLFSENAFEEFQDSNRRAKSELVATASVIPYITGV